MRHAVLFQKLPLGLCILSKTVTALPFGGNKSDTQPKGKLSLNGEQIHSSRMICWQSFWNNLTPVY